VESMARDVYIYRWYPGRTRERFVDGAL
jgi:hypothetical protein